MKAVETWFKDPSLMEPVKVSISEYKGRWRLDIRHYYTDAGGNLLPTKKGVSIPVGVADNLPILIEKVIASADVDERDPLFEDEDDEEE